MADRVLVRQIVTTVETPEGTEVWLEDGEHVRGMVEGGYWEIVRRVEGRAARAVRRSRDVEPTSVVDAPAVAEVVTGGDDQAESDGGSGGDEPSGGA